jgi:hypothetical protein
VKGLLAELAKGNLTIEQLRTQLKRSPKSAAPKHRSHSLTELTERALSDLKKAGQATRKDIVIRAFDDVAERLYFDSRIKPALVIYLPQSRRILVMDDTRWAGSMASFQILKREFLRNVAVGPSLFDLVFVYANTWMADVETLINLMHPEDRARIVLKAFD